MKIELSEFFTKDFKAGYLLQNKEPRKLVLLVRYDGSQTSMSYSRYLMTSYLGRHLDRSEHVDHKDGDCLNDLLDNLQILSPKDNNAKSVVQNNNTRQMIELVCPNCSLNFTKKYNQSFLQKGGKFNACSKKCMYDILSKGYSITELIDLGKNQVVRVFRK